MSENAVVVSGPDVAAALRGMEAALAERRPAVRVSLDVAAMVTVTPRLPLPR